jgi:thiamine biosynthesis protein ThiI
LTKGKSQVTFDTVIVRLGGEIGIKSAWTRRAYERRLVQNVKASLRHYGLPFETVVRRQGRIYIKTSRAPQVAEKLTRVFGISSLSPAIQTTSELEAIAEQAINLAKQKLCRQNSFAVKCRRVGVHPYTSHEVCEHVGQKILDSLSELQLEVDLRSPDVTIGIEIRENQAFIFTEHISASDGLPVGTQPKIIALLKLDVYSPVACWLTMKRGCPPVPVHFNENGNRETVRRVKAICKKVFEWSIGHSKRLYLVPYSQSLALLRQECPSHLLEVVSKRLIYRIASHIAEKEKAEAIVSGETIIGNPPLALRCFKLQDQAVENYPVHRPLIGLTESEIQTYARKIEIPEALAAKPERNEMRRLTEEPLPTLNEIEAVEEKLNLQKMIDAVLKQIETITL